MPPVPPPLTAHSDSCQVREQNEKRESRHLIKIQMTILFGTKTSKACDYQGFCFFFFSFLSLFLTKLDKANLELAF